MKNLFEKIEDLKEEIEQDNEELADVIADAIQVTGKFYKKTKRVIYTRGFMTGALAAVAIQSLLTILVILK